MNTQYIVLVIVAFLLIGGGAYYGIQGTKMSDKVMSPEESAMEKEKDPAHMAEDESMMKKDEMMREEDHVMGDGTVMENDSALMDKKNEVMMTVGVYESYSPEKLSMASKGPVVLFFRAAWCPTCVAADKNIRTNLNSIPAGTTILDVNYDDSADLKKKYGVTYQHTFVQVDASGALIKKWSGSSTLAALLSQIK